MDTLTHALLGAALCSRTGLAGGRRGPVNPLDGRPRVWDWTLGAALFFGILPDLASIGLHLIYHILRHGDMGWHAIPPFIFTLYNLTHSLLIAGVCVLAAALWLRPWAAPMLAWPVHILTDTLTHGAGRFATPIFFPLSDYRFSGVNWWQTPWLARWPALALALLCAGFLAYRLNKWTLPGLLGIKPGTIQSKDE